MLDQLRFVAYQTTSHLLAASQLCLKLINCTTYFWSSIGMSEAASKGTTSTSMFPSRITDNWGPISSHNVPKSFSAGVELAIEAAAARKMHYVLISCHNFTCNDTGNKHNELNFHFFPCVMFVTVLLYIIRYL